MNIRERVCASFCARVIQPWMRVNFKVTRYGLKLKKYKNFHVGEKCFLVGNGPSLKVEDLTKLHQNGEVTFAFNRIYNIFEKTSWRPNYYVSQDEKMLLGCIDEVERMMIKDKFIPINLRWYYGVNIVGANYFLMKAPKEKDGKPLEFSTDISKELYQANTVMYTAAQLAIYMGFKEIYLIGVDHHFQVSQNNKGEIVVDNTVKDYFSDKYNEDKENLYIPNTEKSTLTYIAMKEQCDKRGVKVFNATRGGKLEVFPRVDFDEIFK